MPPPDHPLCISCNYPLLGIESRRCPECGREFDLNDPKSVNFGRPLGAWGRTLVKPVGWPMMLVATAALALLAWLTRWPGFRPQFWWGDAGPAMQLVFSKTRIDDFKALEGRDRLFVAAIMIWWIALAWYLIRELARATVLSIQRPGKILIPKVWRRRTIALLLLAAGLFIIGYGWPHRMGERVIANDIAYLKGPQSTTKPSPALFTADLTIDHGKELQIIWAELASAHDPHQRTVGLMNLIYQRCDDALPILLDRASREKDRTLREAIIHLIGVFRDPKAIDVLVAQLDDPDPTIRAAAIDALSILHSPSYPVPNGEGTYSSGGELRTKPPIELSNIIRLVSQRLPEFEIGVERSQALSERKIALPDNIKARLAKSMTDAASDEERQAAARAMVGSAPLANSLRYAEWGVWIATNSDPFLHLPSNIEEEIPPFVHRLGNTSVSLNDHVFQRPIIINKPVIHLTSNVPLAVDLEVRIKQGRPWFAYPKPDDFSVGVSAQTYSGRGLAPFPEPDPNKSLAKLDNDRLAWFKDAREGYPWLLPEHRQRDTSGGNSWNTMNIMTSLGVRWQSLIVTPQKLSWMRPPDVPKTGKFNWWSRLRDVDCSWVSSRGESERFLYYDGPTLSQTFCEVYLEKEKLRFSPNVALPVKGILIEVKDGKALGTSVEAKADSLTMDFAALRASLKDDARQVLQKMLRGEGLKTSEADGLLDCWAPQFFQTHGLRFIVVVGTSEYDKACPMEIRPKPLDSDRVRVGLQLKEFAP